MAKAYRMADAAPGKRTLRYPPHDALEKCVVASKCGSAVFGVKLTNTVECEFQRERRSVPLNQSGFCRRRL